MNKIPSISDTNVVNILLDNKAQEEELAVKKAMLQEFLRNALNNKSLRIESSINRDESIKKAYTASENLLRWRRKTQTSIP